MTLSNFYAGFMSSTMRTVGDVIALRDNGQSRLCIINYHRILPTPDPLQPSEPDVKTFRWQMELLADCFNVIPLHQAVTALANESMPPRAVSLTFDDGYRSTHDFAFPILKELNLPATVFVATGFLSDGTMWNDTIIEAVRSLPAGELDMREVGLRVYSLKTPEDRKQTIHVLTETSKYLYPEERMNLTLWLQRAAGTVPRSDLMLTRKMIFDLAQQNIEIGAHTVSHPILTSITDECARLEIVNGKQDLEAITGKPVRLFAYPNGRAGIDFDQRHIEMAKDAGFFAAFSTAVGAATREHDQFQLPRGRPWDSSPFKFGARLLYWLAGRAG